MKLVQINKNTNGHGDNVELRLTQAAEYLKESVVTNLLVVMIGIDGSVIDTWANRTDPYIMLGAIESIKADFMKSCIETRE
jgi:hypothetical protein